jgi:hypothetical protein
VTSNQSDAYLCPRPVIPSAFGPPSGERARPELCTRSIRLRVTAIICVRLPVLPSHLPSRLSILALRSAAKVSRAVKAQDAGTSGQIAECTW